MKTASRYAIRLVVGLAVLLLLVILLLYVAMGTTGGSRLILEKIAKEANVQLSYGEGNLRDGLSVSNVHIAQGETVEILINHGYVQMGWRAMFARQVHLKKADIDTVTIINHKPPSDEPFDYATLELPVDLLLENVAIAQVRYEQASQAPVLLHGMLAKKATWQDSQVTLHDVAVALGETLKASQINGEIDLSGDYPLNASAEVMVNALSHQHFAPLHINASGSLKRTVGTVSSLYNEAKVSGSFSVQGLHSGAPFMADIGFERLPIPYATDENIVLHNGRLQATGVLSAIELRLNTELSARNIPNGHYHGRAILAPPSEGMTVHYLAAHTADGQLQASGELDWRDDFRLSSTLSSRDYKLRKALPADYAEYGVYLPERLDGTLNFNYASNDEGDTRYELALQQRDGERVNAEIRQQNSQQAVNPYPWRIDADWQNLQREHLPDIGRLNSPSGQVRVTTTDGKTHIDAKAQITKLSALPSGDYAVQALLQDKDITLQQADYSGAVGNLTASGEILLATAKRPLSYTIHASSTKLLPNVYFNDPKKLPIDTLHGKFTVLGRLRKQNGQDWHEIRLKDSDVSASLGDGQTIRLTGDGATTLQMHGNEIQHLTAKFDGDLATKGLAAGLRQNALSVQVSGDPNHLTVNKLTLDGQAGHLSAAGTLQLNDGVAWQANIRADELRTGAFYERLTATVTGDLTTTGRLVNGQLINTQANFDGRVVADGVPTGNVRVAAVADGDKYTIDTLHYTGEAGELSATGWIDVGQGVRADIAASLQNFNAGYFVKDRPSDISGEIAGAIDWQHNQQAVSIRRLDLTGTMNNHPVAASGTLSATLNLPKDLAGYWASLQRQSFSIDDLLAKRNPRTPLADSLSDWQRDTARVQQGVLAHNKAYRQIIRRLVVDDLTVRFGDNHLQMTGNQDRLSARIEAKRLSQVFPTVQGEVIGTLAMSGGTDGLPTIYADLAIEGLSMPSFAVREASVLGKVVDLGASPSSLVVQAVGVVAGGRTLRQVRLDATGTERNHNLVLFVNDGNVQAHARVQGGLVAGRYTGVVSDGRLQSTRGLFTQVQPSELRYELNTKTLAVAAHCWQTQVDGANTTGSLCLKDNLLLSPEAGQVNMVIAKLDTSVFNPLLPNDLSVQAQLNGAINARWGQGKQPVIDAVLYADNGAVGVRNEGARDTIMPFERLSLLAKSVAGGLQLRTDVRTEQAGTGYVDVVLDPYGKAKPIAGSLALTSFNLAVLRPFFPALQTLAGEINVVGEVAGTLAKPLFHGNAILTDGKLAIVDVPISFNNIALQAKIDGAQASLEGSFTSGEGVGSLQGELDWQRDLQAKLTVAGERLAVVSPPLLTAEVTPHFEIVVRPTQKYVDIKGVIAVPQATIRPPEANPSVIDESPDVIVIDRRMSGDALALLQSVKPWSINADIGLDLGENVVFRGFGANLPLAGALHLTQSGQGVMQARGVIQVSERTTVDAVGQNLELNYAQVRFAGDVKNPRLSIEAVREIDNQTVGVRVTGTVANPIITVFNDANLSEQQAMNALVTGRLSESNTQISEQGFRSQVTNNLAAAGLSLGLRGTRNLTNDIGRALGLESLVVDASGNSDDTHVNVTGYISPDLYIRYGVGVFNAETSLSMRYQLTKRIYVQATSSTERIVDVVYRWRF